MLFGAIDVASNTTISTSTIVNEPAEPEASTSHVELISQKQFSCEVCLKFFKRKGELNRHKKTHSSDRKRFTCTKCEKSYTRKNDLDRHTLTHTVELLFVCEKCDKRFTSRSKLKNHIATHSSDTNNLCEQCGKKFKNKYSLKYHQKIHSSNRNFKCHLCQKSFKSKGCLKLHTIGHLNLRSFKCDLCDNSFNRKNHLERHKLRHLKEIKFRCELCPKGFITKDSLNRHKLTHNSSKDFICDECGKSFYVKSYLTHHMKSHSDETCFVCDVCNMIFSRKFNLLRHKARSCQKKKLSTEPFPEKSVAAHDLPVPSPDIEILAPPKIKEESENIFIPIPKSDNYTPLWLASSEIKAEIEANKTGKSITFFTLDIPNKKKIRKQINCDIKKYISLNDDDRCQHLESRIKERQSAIKELGVEAVAGRDIKQWEVLGHYGGQIFSNEDYEQGTDKMGAPLVTIDRYSYAISNRLFISGIGGNITKRINAFTTYSEIEDKSCLPKQNVCFLNHQTMEGVTIPFLVAKTAIKADETLWLDYGEDYWKATHATEIVSDSDSE